MKQMASCSISCGVLTFVTHFASDLGWNWYPKTRDNSLL